ncbi:MAG: hypothetical protein DHS80DRAFT_31287 [Piptocephalis tieghemiana]|nr:MAG: hypothetical protein DHS80DRAFT_31287 [Piptocephalis tieghemiana]
MKVTSASIITLSLYLGMAAAIPVTPAPHTSGSVPAPHNADSVPAPHNSGSAPAPHTSGSAPVPPTSGPVPAPHTSGSVPAPHTSGSVPVHHAPRSTPIPHSSGSIPVPHAPRFTPVPHSRGPTPAPTTKSSTPSKNTVSHPGSVADMNKQLLGDTSASTPGVASWIVKPAAGKMADLSNGLNGAGEVVAPRMTQRIDNLISGIANLMSRSPFVTDPISQRIISLILYSTSNVPIVGPILQRIDMVGGFGVQHVPREMDKNGQLVLPPIIRLSHVDDVIAVLENAVLTIKDARTSVNSLKWTDVFSIVASTITSVNEIVTNPLNSPAEVLFSKLLQEVNNTVNRFHSLLTSNGSSLVLLPSEVDASPEPVNEFKAAIRQGAHAKDTVTQ